MIIPFKYHFDQSFSKDNNNAIAIKGLGLAYKVGLVHIPAIQNLDLKTINYMLKSFYDS